MKLKLSRDFIISKLNEFIKLRSRELGFVHRDDLYKGYAPDICWNFFNSGIGKFLITNPGICEVDDLFYLNIFKPINLERKHYSTNLFNHIFLNDEPKFKGTESLPSDTVVTYGICEYFMVLWISYTKPSNTGLTTPFSKYYFKLDRLDKLILPEFNDWEIEINGDDLVDNELTRKWLLESI